MAINYPLLMVSATISIFFGMVLHERMHWALGKLTDGEAYISERRFFIPSEVDFDNPEAMTNQEVRIVAGCVLIFPAFVVLTALVAPVAITRYDISPSYSLIWWIVVATCTGGMQISWLDLLGTADPERWKKYTSGKPITRNPTDE